LKLCAIGYVAAGWVSFCGRKPDFVPVEAKADREAFRRIGVMLAIFAFSAIVIALVVWIVMRETV
jgi:hypothetical protein